MNKSNPKLLKFASAVIEIVSLYVTKPIQAHYEEPSIQQMGLLTGQ